MEFFRKAVFLSHTEIQILRRRAAFILCVLCVSLKVQHCAEQAHEISTTSLEMSIYLYLHFLYFSVSKKCFQHRSSCVFQTVTQTEPVNL